MRSKRKSVGVLGAVLAVGAMSTGGVARAQDYGTPPPPIDVPTAPVAQNPNPLPQGPQPPASKKKPPPPPEPAPAPAPTTTTPPPEPTSNPGTSSTPPPPTTFNNEGVFKISGSKGPGTIGSAAPKGAKTTQKFTPKKAVAKKADAAIAEWPGFRMTDDGGSEVMVEFSKALAAPTEHKAAGSITYVFPGAVVTKHNNKNPLLTIHFNTPVLDARLVSAKGELHLVVELRPGVDVAPITGMRPATEGNKQQFFVKFPSGSYLPANDDLDTSPNAKTEQGKKAFEKKKKGNGGGTGNGAEKGPKP